MTQLWQMIKKILGLSEATDAEVAALAATLVTIGQKLDQILAIVQKIQSAVMPLPATGFIFIVWGQEVNQVQMKDNQVLTVTIGPTDALGNPTTLDPAAAPAWAVDNAALATVTPSADGLSVQVKPVGPLGSFNVQCSIPAAGAEGALSGSLAVDIIASAATTIVLQGTAQ